LNRRARVRQQRFAAHFRIGMDICERRQHRMALVSAWSLNIPHERQLWECNRCHQRFIIDLTRTNRFTARHGIALYFDCPRQEV
jgi:hypothetical protein